jgi:hypothetical protein
MAKIEKVKQSVFGRTLGAELHAVKVRPVDMAAPLERGLSQFVQGATSLVNTISHLKEEEANAALEQAQADYLQEVTEGLNKEVYSLHGEALHGAEDRARKIQLDALNRQREKLSRYGAETGRRFSLFAQRNSTGETSRVVHYAAGEIRQATAASAQRTQAASMNSYAASGDVVSMENAMNAVDTAWKAKNGRLVDDERLARLEHDVTAGYVMLRGEKLRIVDEVKEGETGVIRRDLAEDLLGRYSREHAAWRQERQRVADTMHAARVNQLLKWDDIPGAEAHLEKFKDSMGPQAYNALRSQTAIYRKQLDAKLSAGEWATNITAAYAKVDKNSLNGKISSPHMEKRIQDCLDEQAAKARKDPNGPEMAKYNAMVTQANQIRQSMHLNEKAETDRIMNALGEKNLLMPGNEAACIEELQKQPQSYVQEALLRWAIQRKVQSDTRLQNSPEYKKANEPRLLEFMRILAKGGKVSFKGRTTGPDGKGLPALTFDLSKPEEMEKAMDWLGFSEKEKLRIRASKDDTYSRAAATEILVDLLNELNLISPTDERRFTASGLNLAASGLVNLITNKIQEDAPLAEKLRGRDSHKLTKEERKELTGRIRELLRSIEVTSPGILRDSKIKLYEYLAKGLKDDGGVDAEYSYEEFNKLAMTESQLRAYNRALSEYNLANEPRKAGETDNNLTLTGRNPNTTLNSAAEKITGRVKYGNYYYTKEVAEQKAAERREKEERWNAKKRMLRETGESVANTGSDFLGSLPVIGTNQQ